MLVGLELVGLWACGLEGKARFEILSFKPELRPPLVVSLTSKILVYFAFQCSFAFEASKLQKIFAAISTGIQNWKTN